MAKTEKKVSIIEMPLKVEPWQADRLNKRMDTVTRIYNSMLRYELGKYNEITKTKQYREDSKYLYETYEAWNSLKAKKKKTAEEKALFEEYDKKRKEIFANRNELYKNNNLSEFGFIDDAARFGEPFTASISSNVRANTIAKPMWKAFEKLIFGNGHRVSFRKFQDTNSLVSNNKSGIRFLIQDEEYVIIISNRNAHAKPMTLKLYQPSNEYEQKMLTDYKVLQTRIVRKLEKTKYHYYCQITVESAPYQKVDADGNNIHNIAEGSVGLCIWRNRLVAISDNEVKSFDLTPDYIDVTERLRDLQREMDEITRRDNPNNFNADGTIKKGLVVDGKKQRLEWVRSRRYKELSYQVRELHRKEKVKRSLYQNSIVYELLSMGNTFYIYDSKFLTAKDKDIEEQSLAEQKIKKDRRRSIQQAAPSQLIEKLSTKLNNFDLPKVQKVKIADEHYWYDISSNTCNKDAFHDDYIELNNGTTIPHTLYRAFMVQYYNGENDGFGEVSAEEWDKFLKLAKSYQSVLTNKKKLMTLA